MTKDIYAKKFKVRVRRDMPKHLILDAAIRKKTSTRKHKESRLSAIQVPKSKKIFLTNESSANSLRNIKKNNIKAILTLGVENTLQDTIIDEVCAYKVCNAKDLSTIDNVFAFRNVYFPQTRSFIKHWISHGNILIHCKRGVCRTPLVVLDYLINVSKVSIEEAASLLMDQRNCAQPTTILLQSIF